MADSTLLVAQPPALVVGGWVRWYANGWRNGRLIEIGTKWAKVEYVGKTKRILLTEVQPYDAKSS